MSRAQWEWRFTDETGAVLDRPLSPVFTTRFDAEAWVGEHWRHLVEREVDGAQLLHDGAPVGPPLPLGSAGS